MQYISLCAYLLPFRYKQQLQRLQDFKRTEFTKVIAVQAQNIETRIAQCSTIHIQYITIVQRFSGLIQLGISIAL